MKNTWKLNAANNQRRLVAGSALNHDLQTITRRGEAAVAIVAASVIKRSRLKQKSILELFKPVRGLELETRRDKSPARKVTL